MAHVASTKWSPLRRTIAVLCAFAAFGLLGWIIYLDGAYAATMPRAPDANSGRVVPMTIQHGTHIFVTPSEEARFHRVETYLWFGWPVVMLFATIGASDRLWNRKDRL